MSLQLGDFVFSGFEIPPNIRGGGKQRVAEHKLLGGARVVNALGADDADLAWSGRMQGRNARDRALYLDQLRKAGKVLPLTWDVFDYDVLVVDFQWRYEAAWQVLYSIQCLVVADKRAAVPLEQLAGLDSMLTADIAQATGISALFDLTQTTLAPTLQAATGALASAQSAMSMAQPLLSNVPGAQTVFGYLGKAQSGLSAASALADGDLAGLGALGGQIAGLSGAKNAASLSAAATSMLNAGNIQMARGYVDRAVRNLSDFLGQQ